MFVCVSVCVRHLERLGDFLADSRSPRMILCAEKIIFLYSISKNVLDTISIYAQLHSIHKCPQISEQFKFKRSNMYKCLKKRCKHKSTLPMKPSAAIHHHFWNCSNDMFKFSNCSYEMSWNQLSRKKTCYL